MNRADFADEFPGRLVRTSVIEQLSSGPETTECDAYIPASLPPLFSITPQIVRKLSAADRALGELSGLTKTIQNPLLLIQPFLRREAVLSSRIEGTRTTLEELYAFEEQIPLFQEDDDRSRQDAQEVLNYVRALQFGRRVAHTQPLGLPVMRELHKTLLRGVRGESAVPGEFRTIQNHIGEPGSRIVDARFVPPPPLEVEPLLRDLHAYISKTDDDWPPLARLAWIHYHFEAIHPFRDGNGRIGRLLVVLLLESWGLLPEPLLYLSAYFERKKQEYYNHLLAVSLRGSWHEWLSFFLDAVETQALDAIQRGKQLQMLRQEWENQLKANRASASAVRLMAELFVTPVLTVTRAQQAAGLDSYRGARITLDRLLKLGLVREGGRQKRPKVYVAQKILDICSGP
ncbi:MAG TPA: Fic family protein [Bryobacteraceae bacterium]|nr:Fic family protein [Bryobacteraceae bacterium]